MNPNPAPVARPEGVTKTTKTGLVFALIVTIFFAVGVLGVIFTGNAPLVPAVLLFVPAVLSEQMAERALVRALDGSWRIKGGSAKNHIRIQFDDGSFRFD